MTNARLDDVDLLRRAQPTALVVTILAVAGYAWWATGLRPFTRPALAATIGGGLASIALGARRPAPARATRRPLRSGDIVWAMLFVALACWELVFFFHHPRADHPTLSSLANSVLQSHPARALAFVVWLVVGADLARR